MIDKAELRNIYNNIVAITDVTAETEKFKNLLTLEVDTTNVSEYTSELQEIYKKFEGNSKLSEASNKNILLDLKIYINKLRNEYNIVNPDDIIHTDKKGNDFVQ